MSSESSPKRSRLPSTERKIPSRVKSHSRRCVAGTAKPPSSSCPARSGVGTNILPTLVERVYSCRG